MTRIRGISIASAALALVLAAEVAPAADRERCTITGSAKDEVLKGTRHKDVICAKAGDDLIKARAGKDVVRGGPGADVERAQAGDDVLRGGAGDDRIAGQDGDDALFGDPQDDFLDGGAGNDQLDGGSGEDQCEGGEGSDQAAGGCEDTTPPELVAVSVSPAVVDTTSGPATLTFTIEAVDDLSGARAIDVTMRAPDGSGLTAHGTGGGQEHLVDTAQEVLPQGSAQGTWTLARVMVEDWVGNQDFYSAAELEGAGIEASFEQVGEPDTQAPELQSFSLTPSSLDTSGAAGAIELTVEATDDLTGVSQAHVDFRYPNRPGVIIGRGLNRTSGTAASGTWTSDLELPRYSAQGTYEVLSIELYDGVGNRSFYSASQFPAGSPTSFTQTGPGDATDPVLADFDISPTAINTAGAKAVIDATFRVTDDLSGLVRLEGMTSVGASIIGPTGIWYYGDEVPHKIGGTSLDGTWLEWIRIPRYAPSGTYRVAYVHAIDRIGNEVVYTTDQLSALGFPTTIVND